jgi:hypothetical protein
MWELKKHAKEKKRGEKREKITRNIGINIIKLTQKKLWVHDNIMKIDSFDLYRGFQKSFSLKNPPPTPGDRHDKYNTPLHICYKIK